MVPLPPFLSLCLEQVPPHFKDWYSPSFDEARFDLGTCWRRIGYRRRRRLGYLVRLIYGHSPHWSRQRWIRLCREEEDEWVLLRHIMALCWERFLTSDALPIPQQQRLLEAFSPPGSCRWMRPLVGLL